MASRIAAVTMVADLHADRGMRRIAACASVLLSLSAALVGFQRQPTFQAGVQLVALSITVQHANGARVEHLQQRDFRVFDEGVSQPIVLFATESTPVDLLLLIDTSGSMATRLDAAKRAAVSLVNALTPLDRAALMSFSDRSNMVQTFTSNAQRIRGAIEHLPAAGSTALYDSLYVALNELRPTSTEPRRRALVLLSDGDDTKSLLPFEAVLRAVREFDTAVYTISLAKINGGADRARFSESQYAMQSIARDSGGRAYLPTKIEELTGTYGEIARELAHQYWLAFEPGTPSQGKLFRRVSVVVDAPNSTVRTRAGYSMGH